MFQNVKGNIYVYISWALIRVGGGQWRVNAPHWIVGLLFIISDDLKRSIKMYSSQGLKIIKQ